MSLANRSFGRSVASSLRSGGRSWLALRLGRSPLALRSSLLGGSRHAPFFRALPSMGGVTCSACAPPLSVLGALPRLRADATPPPRPPFLVCPLSLSPSWLRHVPPPSPLGPAKPAGGTPPHAPTTHPPSPLAPAKPAGGTPPHAATTHPTSPPCRCGTWGRHANGTPTARQRHANGTPTARQRHANGTPTDRQTGGFWRARGNGENTPPLAPQRQ